MMLEGPDGHGKVFRAGIAAVRAAIQAFAPDITIVFGTDHRRAFVSTVPAMAVITEASGWGDYGLPTDPFRVDRATAEELASGLLASGMDVAVSRAIRLDHGFGQAVRDLLGGDDHRPFVPVFINCATPPLPDARRVVELGQRVGQAFDGAGERILFVGTGGLSHSPPSLAAAATLPDAERRALNDAALDEAATKIRPEWDMAFLKMLCSDDRSWRNSFDQPAMDAGGVGANEVRTWVAAWAASGDRVRTIAYEPVPEWITGMGIVGSAWAFDVTSNSADGAMGSGDGRA